MKTAVIAGTPVDTEMGVNYLAKKDPLIEAVSLPLKSCPRECHLFQLKEYSYKMDAMTDIVSKAKVDGTDNVFVYCNSLSSSLDFEKIASAVGIKIVTPGNAYEKFASLYSTIGVIAANNQSTRWIENIFTAGNPAGYVLGAGNLKLVEAVEKKHSPDEIVQKFALRNMTDYFAASGAEAVVLGCTHFPYFMDALQQVCPLPVIDPADIMYDELIE